MRQNVYDIFLDRGLVEWCSNPEPLRELFSSETVSGYIGFDPSADSLHVGHLVPLMGLAWMQKLGHRPIAIAGAGTGMIGDPSGKSKERNLLTLEQIESNLESVGKQLEQFLDFDCGENAALMVNNYDWLGKLSMIDFLRDVGKHFSVNYMINREYVRSRLDDPSRSISYTEFAYMLLQAYDFYHLYENEGCRLQMGGNDQQGNILAGIDLIRKKTGGDAFGITYPLLLSATGNKFGKTEEGTIWLSPERTSPYRFYQYFINADDRDVAKLLRYFTFLSLEEVDEIASSHQAAPERREGQRRLAREVTTIVHGGEAADRAARASEILFGGKFEPDDLSEEMLATLSREVPTGEAARADASVIDILAESGACASKSEARRLIRGGGVSLNGRKVDDEKAILSGGNLLPGGVLFFRLGKRRFHLVHITGA
ncbi:MAG: tyrosine--tRNA ligase [Synergistales bacterium]|nr:tyrosine--tRNA ligase [Synergistales bacterium]